MENSVHFQNYSEHNSDVSEILFLHLTNFFEDIHLPVYELLFFMLLFDCTKIYKFIKL